MKSWRGLFLVVSLAGSVYFLLQVWMVIAPFLIGFVVAYLVQPLVDRFVALGMRRDRTVLVMFVLLLGLTSLMAFFLVPLLIHEANEILHNLPQYLSGFDAIVDKLNTELKHLLAPILGKKAGSYALPLKADKLTELMITRLPENLANVAHVGMWLLIIPFTSFFGLSHGRNWIDSLFSVTPSEYVESLLGLMAEINAALGGYVRGQMLEAICVGFFTMIGLWFLGFDGAVFMGFLTGILNLVPFMAPVVGGAIALLIGHFQGLATGTLVGIVLLFILVRLLDDFIFIPFVLGNSVHLHPVVMLFSVLAGFELAGLIGLIFAIPATAILKVVFSIALSNRRTDILITNQNVLS